MSIAAGTRLGPYEVTSLLGAGGMGEVYRARDTRLDRTVAVKVLPQRATTTTQARERFEREARAISALNHPNICTLFDVGSHDGTEYLVMELIDGEPLKGPLPLPDVLRIGAAIADALAKAHRAGIVHRDLKPQNILLTKSGPKLLDFGLARKAEEAHRNDATTVIGAAPITTEGTLLGTLPYMAPEQLEGKPADARTDIFAFGAVLYELITGRRAFQAESQASLITKIMSAQPAPLAEVQPVTPASLNRLVMRCLEKDPDDRWQSAADIAAELRWIAEGGATQTAVASKKRALVPWLLAAPLAIAVLALLALRRPAASARTVRFGVDPPPDARFEIDQTWPNLAVSPDGKLIAFVARDHARRLWIYNIATGVSKPLEGTEQARSPFWSRDGKVLGFATPEKLKSVTLDENRVQNICDVASGMLHATWLADGTIVYSELMASAVSAVPGGGGTPRQLFGTTKESAIAPFAVGDTHHFFFCAVGVNKTSLWIGDTDGGARRKLIDDAGRAAYDAPYVTFVRDGTLLVQRFNERTMALEGNAVPLADDVWFYKPLGHSLHSAAGDTIAYTPATFIRNLRWIDRTGSDHGEALSPGRYRDQLRISPDGRNLAVTIEDPHTSMGDIWTVDLQRQSPNRLTFGEHDYDNPSWSRDGRTLAFSSDPLAPPYVFTMSAGGGPQKAVTKPGTIQYASDWRRDGRILYTDESKADIMLTNPDEPWLNTPAAEGDARISPDQKWVAYASLESDLSQIFVMPFDHHAARVRVSTNGGRIPAWSADGQEIYFKHQQELWAAKVKISGDTIDTDPPVRFFASDKDIESYDVAPDGRILVNLHQTTPMTSPMRVIVGWKEEAARLLARK